MQPPQMRGATVRPTRTATNAETDSWIEVSSHPSDSVYTSSSDERIITAGLRISQARRRRRPAFKTTSPSTARPEHAHEPGSSSEGEEEGEGDEDEGEGEDLGSLIHEMPESSDGYSSPEDDSDDEASASDSPGPRTVFASASSQRRQGIPSNVSGLRGAAAASTRHGPGAFNVFAPNHAADHDEALRASLSTLLSCAAAARGLTKSPMQSQQQMGTQQQPPAQQGGRVAVEGIRVIRQGDLPSAASSGSITGQSRRSSVGSASGSVTPASCAPSPSSEKQSKRDGKKKSSATTTTTPPKSRSPRKSRSRVRAENESESPLGVSYMTLAVSAGALVLLSAITFSAGYAMGREVGKSEGGLLESVTGSAAKGKAVVRGLTRSGGAAAAGKGISMGGNFTSVTA